MKKHNLIICLLFLLLLSCNKPTCSKYKTGNYLIVGDELYSDNYSIRTDTTEIIYNDSIGFKDVFKISWTNDCSYYMIFQSSNNQKLMQITSADTIFIEILETNERGFRFKRKVNDKEYFAEEIKL